MTRYCSVKSDAQVLADLLTMLCGIYDVEYCDLDSVSKHNMLLYLAEDVFIYVQF